MIFQGGGGSDPPPPLDDTNSQRIVNSLPGSDKFGCLLINKNVNNLDQDQA